jgi:hypothetical protein
VHGGLSPELSSVTQISELELPITDYFLDPLVSDLVWSDPSHTVPGFIENHRGSGVLFGTQAVKNFLANTGLNAMIRAHQCVGDGWLTFAENCGVTVFSSSEYCRLQHNRAGVICVTEDATVELMTMDQKVRPMTVKMGYAKPIGLKRIFGENSSLALRGTNEGTAALRSRLANRFNTKKTVMVTPKKAQKTPRGSPGSRVGVHVNRRDENVM